MSQTASAADAPQWAGMYDDPNHKECKRKVVKVGKTKLRIDGRDGEPDCGDGFVSTPFSLTATLKSADSDEVLIDFSSKGGPADLLGKWDGDGIKFPDGNKWTKKKDDGRFE